MHRSLRTALPIALVSLAIATGPVAAFQPSVEVADLSTRTGRITDVASRGSTVVVTMDLRLGDLPEVWTYRSTEGGADGSWIAGYQTGGLLQIGESSAAVCAGQAITVYVREILPTSREVRSHNTDLTSLDVDDRAWTPSGVGARRPDVACVANAELAIAWFERLASGGYKVVLETGTQWGTDATPQRFSLGKGIPSRGLSVAATSDRVYVAWFQGSTLKVRRFRIGTTSAHTLTSLGTTTIGTFQGGTTPKIGADGSRVVLAYTQGADLKVRRSANRGVSFGSARTIRNLPDASEVGSLATTVAVKGKLVALGTIDVGGIDTLYGDGRGYKSTNGGASFTRLTTHTGRRVLATVVKPGSSYRWAEVWDQSLSGDSPGLVRFRRQ